MSASAPQTRTSSRTYRPIAQPSRIEAGRLSSPVVLGAIARVFVGVVLIVALALIGPGVFLDTPQPPPQTSDAIVVISGDEQMARFQEGVNLYQPGMARFLVFSGPAHDNAPRNPAGRRNLSV